MEMAMEVSNGVAMRLPPCFYSGVGVGIDARHRVCFRRMNRVPCELNYRESKFFARSLRRRVVGEFSGFDEKGHMVYYNSCSTPVCGGEMKKKEKEGKKGGWYGVSEKKRAKLLKDLAKNLSMFSELGFGLQSDEAKGKIISKASEVLLSQLEHLRAEEKKLKKEVEMAYLETKQMATAMDDSESSSSSESSDSECDDDELISIPVLHNEVAAQPMVEESMKSECGDTIATSLNSPATLEPEEPCAQDQPKMLEEVGVVGLTVHNMERNCSNTDTSTTLKRVEICMGGKCKKLGAQVLMDEFRNVLGVEGSVVGCKCMGKCKTAPNVRVFNGAIGDRVDDSSVKTPSNPLCIGVGMEDVGLIVANYFGRSRLK